MIYALFTLLLAFETVAAARTHSFIPEESILAVVTQKEGIAAALAHNHFAFAESPTVSLDLDEAHLESANISVKFPVENLRIDQIEVTNRWFPLVQQYEILKDPLTALSEANQRSIRETMLSDKQLDIQRYPEISASIAGLLPNPLYPAQSRFSHSGKLTLNIHGQSVVKLVPLNLKFDGDTLSIDSLETFNFTDFGIEPFSAFAGTIKNKNRFHLMVRIKAKRDQP